MAICASGSRSSWRRSAISSVSRLAERVEFGRRLADQVLLAVGDLEGRAPHLAPPFLGEIAEILHEAENEVGLGEEQIDGIVELQFVVQFLQPVLDFNRMGAQRVRRSSVMRSARLMARMTPLIGCRAAVLLQQRQEGQPALLVAIGIGILRGVAAGGVDDAPPPR